MKFGPVVDTALILAFLTACMGLLRFVVTKCQIESFQSAAEMASLWLDYLKPIRWYAGLQNRVLLQCIGLITLLFSAGYMTGVLRRALASIPSNVLVLAPVALAAALFLRRHPRKLGDTQLAVLAGERDNFYKLEHTLPRFFANCVRALLGLAIPTVGIVIMTFVGLWFGPQIFLGGRALDEGPTLALTLIMSIFFLWELMTATLLVLVLISAVMAFAVLHMVFRVITWVSYKVADHPSGAFGGTIYFVMAFLAIAGLVVRLVSNLKAAGG